MSDFFLNRFSFLRGSNRKREAKRTDVLKEVGKRISADHLFFKSLWKQWKEEREEGRGKEGSVFFQVGEDGKSWVYQNILLVSEGASAYRVYIKGLEEGWEEADMITCYLPNIASFYYFLNLILQGKAYYFSSIAKFKPLC